jgi:topoisomerase IV subunit A
MTEESEENKEENSKDKINGHSDNNGNEARNDDAPSEESTASQEDGEDGGNITPLSGMYEDWFLDYASYVILERAVPALSDGLKPVQRRILHSMKEMDDGRFNKVANVIGNTMKYHPHGDQSIGDAMVQIGQKEIIIDTQGNWGNTLTGDRAAAPRYIEARLTKFALHTSFNAKTTDWLASYDGRNKEPVHLPIKFPLLLAQGAEGIAVGLACKMLPHNFVELIDGSIDMLRGKRPKVLPDFPNGGMADFSNYNDGLRGGKVRVRAKISKVDSKTLMITEIPYGSTTDSLIASIIKANDKGKIKVRKIEDNTAATAEIMIKLPSGVSPDKMIDALYAFSDCEISISPNACVIVDEQPVFMGVTDILRANTERTKELLKLELEIKLAELKEQWHFASLEKIFIEKRIYRDIEECETWEAVIAAIDKGLHQYISTPGRSNKKVGAIRLHRDVIEEDIVKLTEIKIKRISKFDSFKADENILKLEDELEKVQHNLDNLVDFSIAYFKELKAKFGKERGRKTLIKMFDNVQKSAAIVSNKKLYVNRKEGFFGWSLRKDEFVQDCSEIDDIIIFFESGKMIVTKITDKKFVGKGILHIQVWKKGDKRTIYHMIYQDGRGGPSYMKRFFINSVTRDKEYDLTNGNKGSKIHYFSCNPNGRKEVVTVQLRPRPHLKKLKIQIDFSLLGIKGRGSRGNRVTKDLVSKVIQREVGGSTLAARKIWWDDVVQRLNGEQRGILLGEFKGEDKILTVYKGGYYRITGFELSNKFDEDLEHIEKWHPKRPLACVYWEGSKELYFVKRFIADPSSKKVYFVPEGAGNEMKVLSTQYEPKAKIIYNKHLKATKHLPDKEVLLNNIIDVKGVRAQGNQLTNLKVKDVQVLIREDDPEWPEETIEEQNADISIGQEANDTAHGPDTASSQDVVENKGQKGNGSTKNILPEAKAKSKKQGDQKNSGKIVGSTNSEKPVVVELEVDASTSEKKGEDSGDGNSSDNAESQTTLF